MIHEHHTWPKFMDNPHGYSWKDNVSRINLSEENHKRLHYEVILNILNENSRALKQYKSEEYIWKNFIANQDKERVIEEVVKKTMEFYNKVIKNGDTKTTA